MMFGKKEKKQAEQKKRQEAYERVYALHEQADFLCYINDVYPEEYKGESFIKLEGLVAKGRGTTEDTFLLVDCEGREKAAVTMEELYLGKDSVKVLEGGDKRVALYPREQEVPYRAGDILCKLKKKEEQQERDD
ncbi:MAG: hypothetical protein NC300_03425 [Bacteroidales bacterium]|nr:hypothetical protein [Clostridium sp.]MCM1203170.1 hypothetical protein [Bacteroidales bacterium]